MEMFRGLNQESLTFSQALLVCEGFGGRAATKQYMYHHYLCHMITHLVRA